MSALSDTLGTLARAGGVLLRIPTAFILGWAGLVLVILGLQTWALIAGGVSAAATVLLLVLLVLLAAPVALLAIRRRRWLRRTEHAGPTGGAVIVGSSTDLVTIDALGDSIEDEIVGMEGEEDVRAVMDAFTELQLSPAERGAGATLTRVFGFGRLAVIGRVFGRIERAQRSLLAAAGGPANAPYLADDLRVTVAAFVGTLVTIALGGLLVIVLAIALVAR
jgi:multisubunit Na+/H+ antiporter MnhG subunit